MTKDEFRAARRMWRLIVRFEKDVGVSVPSIGVHDSIWPVHNTIYRGFDSLEICRFRGRWSAGNGRRFIAGPRGVLPA